MVSKRGMKRARFGLARGHVTSEVNPMPDGTPNPASQVVVATAPAMVEVTVQGEWRVTGGRPRWPDLRPPGDKRLPVRVQAGDLRRWDTSLILFLNDIEADCRLAGVGCDFSGLPETIRALVGQLSQAQKTTAPFDRSEGFLSAVGNATFETGREAAAIFQFVGDTVLGLVRVAKHPRKFRWRDWAYELQQCGAMALPIVSLISFLVGVTLAYTGAVVLRQYGGDIYIADLIGLSMVRETGAVMTAVVLAGRTGAAFAATLGNMKANEEIDALETLGIAPVQFLVLPRLLALGIMTPLLAVYANALGMVGGMAVALGLLNIQPSAYWAEMQTSIDMSDMWVGIIKAAAFGVIIALAGCLRGLQAERSAAGVGRAATSAVVTAILLLVVADAIFAVIFNILGW
jgi:phospholipid/cholesterol/gamma-HCH transport system permease protein